MFELDLSDVKPSILNLFIVTMMAIIGIVLLKFLVNQYDNQATQLLRPLINAV